MTKPSNDAVQLLRQAGYTPSQIKAIQMNAERKKLNGKSRNTTTGSVQHSGNPK